MAFTAKTYVAGKAPKKITLTGDKTKQVESAQHIIEFPGGAVEVSRTTDGNYWVHVSVNINGDSSMDGHGMNSAQGEIVDTRVDFVNPKLGVCDIQPRGEPFTQVAVLIRPVR